MYTKKALKQAVRAILDQGEWPEYKTQDDRGLEAQEYEEFVAKVLTWLKHKSGEFR